MLDDRPGRENRARGGKALNTRGDVHRLTEIVLPVVHHHREAWSLVDSDLEQQVAIAVLDAGHRVAHAQRGRNRPVRGRKRGHDRITDGLHHRTGFGGDDLGEDAEMRSHQIVRNEIADPLIELGRALEIRKQKGEAGYFQPLVDVERIGTIDVPERLIREQALGREEGAALAEQVMEPLAGDPHRRQHAHIGSVFQRQPQWSRMHVKRRARSADFVENDREILAVSRRFALDV